MLGAYDVLLLSVLVVMTCVAVAVIATSIRRKKCRHAALGRRAIVVDCNVIHGVGGWAYRHSICR